MFFIIESYLPYPVADVGRLINDGSRITAGVRVCLTDIKDSIIDNTQLCTIQVTQYGTVTFIYIYNIEIKPVGHFVVRVACGIGYIYLIATITLILCIRARTC